MAKKTAHYNSNRASLLRFLLAPKFWPLWLLQLFFIITCRLPYRWQLSMGKGIGKLLYLFCMKWRKTAATNINLCFKELSVEERKILIKKHFSNLGMSLMETGMSWWLPFEKLPPCQFEGFEHFLNAAKLNKGVLMLGPHLTTMEILARILLSQQIPFHVVARHQNNPFVDALLKRSRNAKNLTSIDRGNIRTVINVLKKNGIVWYAPDQDYGRKHSVFAPFFNIPAATITTPRRIVKNSQSPVVCVAYYRLEQAKGFKIVFYPALQNFPSENEIADASLINQFVETAIRQYPEQYLWIHRRFKTRPEGENNFYEKASHYETTNQST